MDIVFEPFLEIISSHLYFDGGACPVLDIIPFAATAHISRQSGIRGHPTTGGITLYVDSRKPAPNLSLTPPWQFRMVINDAEFAAYTYLNGMDQSLSKILQFADSLTVLKERPTNRFWPANGVPKVTCVRPDQFELDLDPSLAGKTLEVRALNTENKNAHAPQVVLSQVLPTPLDRRFRVSIRELEDAPYTLHCDGHEIERFFIQRDSGTNRRRSNSISARHSEHIRCRRHAC